MNKLKEMLLKDKKTSNLVLILFLLVIVLIFMNYIFNSDDKEEKSVQTISTDVKSSESIDTRLSNIIAKIDQVESASVLVSYSSTEKIIPVYDTKENVDSTTEQNKTSTKKTVEKTVAYEGNSALLESREQAIATGAVIVVTGNITENTKEQIRNAVSFTTGAPIHRIQIFVN